MFKQTPIRIAILTPAADDVVLEADIVSLDGLAKIHESFPNHVIVAYDHPDTAIRKHTWYWVPAGLAGASDA